LDHVCLKRTFPSQLDSQFANSENDSEAGVATALGFNYF